MKKTYVIENMSCAHCEKRILDKMESLNADATIDLDKKALTVNLDTIDEIKLLSELEEMDYPATK